MGVDYNPKIVTNGLVLCLDAANVKSYPGSGTTWIDLSGNGNNGTLTNTTYSQDLTVLNFSSSECNLGQKFNFTSESFSVSFVITCASIIRSLKPVSHSVNQAPHVQTSLHYQSQRPWAVSTCHVYPFQRIDVSSKAVYPMDCCNCPRVAGLDYSFSGHI